MNQGTDIVEDQISEDTIEDIDLHALLAERDSLVDQLQRSVAEFQNYRRRVNQDSAKLRDIATQDVMRSVLPLIDDLQRAISVLPDDQRESGLGEGLSAIERKFLGILERYNVTSVGTVGDTFDPAFHEAVATDESGTGTHVVEVYQTGYRQGESVLRPAMVKVGAEVLFNA